MTRLHELELAYETGSGSTCYRLTVPGGWIYETPAGAAFVPDADARAADPAAPSPVAQELHRIVHVLAGLQNNTAAQSELEASLRESRDQLHATEELVAAQAAELDRVRESGLVQLRVLPLLEAIAGRDHTTTFNSFAEVRGAVLAFLDDLNDPEHRDHD